MQKSNNLCRYFQQGRCHFGDRCKFQHPGSLDGSYDARDTINQRGGGSGGSNNRQDNYNYQSRGGGRQTNYSWTNQRGGYSNQGQRNYGGGGGGGGSFQTSNRYATLDNQGTSQPGRGAQSQSIKDMSSNEIIELLSEAMDLWEKGNMWLFTCVSWGGDYDCLPGFEDLSPEELRLKAYEAQAGNSIDSYKQWVTQLTGEIRQKRGRIKDPNAITKRELADMIETLKKNGPVQSSNSAFGGSTSTAGQGTTLFGKPVGQPTNLFGKPADQSASLFGKPVDQSAGLFGKPAAASAGIFANSGATGGSMFGGSTAGSGFGGNSSAQASATPFGGQTAGTATSAPSAFGKPSLFGSTPAFDPAKTSTPFPPTNQNQAAGTAFGQSQSATQNTPFGQPQSAFTSPGFGGASPIVSQPGAFGANVTSPISSQTSVFGISTAPQPGTQFTQSSTNIQSTGALNVQSTSALTVQSAASASQYTGGSTLDQKGLPMYTALDKLTAEDRAAFEAPKFVLGKIPLCPPPRELV